MPEVTVYRVKEWDKVFENYRSREVTELKYVSWPVRRRSESFAHIMTVKNGIEAFGVWGLIVQVAATCPTRGVLRDDKGPITPERIARRFNAPEDAVRRGWCILVSSEVGWLQAVTRESVSSTDGSVVSTDRAPTAHDPLICSLPVSSSPVSSGKGERGKTTDPDVSTGFDQFWKAYPSFHRKDDKKACQRKWVANSLGAELDRILASVEAWKACEEWQREAGQYIPAPLVFLNKRKWDAPDPPPAGSVPDERSMTSYELMKLKESRNGTQPTLSPAWNFGRPRVVHADRAALPPVEGHARTGDVVDLQTRISPG